MKMFYWLYLELTHEGTAPGRFSSEGIKVSGSAQWVGVSLSPEAPEIA